MNIRNLKIFSFIGAVSLLTACVEVDKTLGVGFVPDNAMVGVEQMVIDLPVYTAKLDSVITSSTTVGAVGYLKHSEFGLFTAGSVFRMLPYTLGFDYGAGAVLDSAVLTISVAKRTQLSDAASVSQPLALYRLNRDLAYNTAYYNTSLKPNDYDPTKISAACTYTGTDTIKIRLEDGFVNELLTATEAEKANDTLFLQKFKGFYLAADTSGANENNSQVSYFDLTTTYITVTYHNTGNDTARYFYYFIEQSTPNFNVYSHGSSTLSNYANPLPAQAEKVYLEGLAGVKPYIDFDQVKDSITKRIEDVSKLVINKVELVVPIDYPASSLDLCPANLTLAYKDSIYAFSFLTDTYFDTFGGALNRSLQQYSFNLTYYVQGLFSKQALYHTTDRKMYLYPIYSTYDSYGSEVKLLEKNYYTCGIIKGITGGKPAVKLKLTYTMLK
jgi:hypothetical protein